MASTGSPRRLALGLIFALVAGFATASPATAAAEKERRGDILIRGDQGFTAQQGIRSGSGTEKDPYLISGWSVNSLVIKDTAAYVTIENNDIRGRLILDWNGDRVKVVNNTIGDLRVNQNVKRTGDRTSGLIANNTIDFVGQLRHWDGVFENNVVGFRDTWHLPYFDSRAVNFDGFNGAKFRNNTIYGYVDVKLHGHHHGSGFGEDSHHHGEGHAAHGTHGDGVDHTERYHEVRISGNKIYAPGRYALRWHDTAHAPDDRRNASETSPDLEKQHIHYTRVRIDNNELIGSGLLIDVFNAKDERHTGYSEGRLQVTGNRISVARGTTEDLPYRPLHGIEVRRARSLRLHIAENTIQGDGQERLPTDRMVRGDDAGIRLYDFDTARLTLDDNRIIGFPVGIGATYFTDSVHWWIKNLQTEDVGQDVAYDSTVANRPNGG